MNKITIQLNRMTLPEEYFFKDYILVGEKNNGINRSIMASYCLPDGLSGLRPLFYLLSTLLQAVKKNKKVSNDIFELFMKNLQQSVLQEKDIEIKFTKEF